MSMGMALARDGQGPSGNAAATWTNRWAQMKLLQNGGPRGSRRQLVSAIFRPRFLSRVSSSEKSRYAADQSTNCWPVALSIPLTVWRPRATSASQSLRSGPPP